MVTVMTNILVLLIPETLGTRLPIVVVLSLPARLLFSPGAFYFGVLPVLAEIERRLRARSRHDRSRVTRRIDRLVSCLTVHRSPYLLIGPVGIELGEHIKFTLPL